MDERWYDNKFRNDDTNKSGVCTGNPDSSDAGLSQPLAYFPYPRKIKAAGPDVDGAVWETSEVKRIRAQKRFSED